MASTLVASPIVNTSPNVNRTTVTIIPIVTFINICLVLATPLNLRKQRGRILAQQASYTQIMINSYFFKHTCVSIGLVFAFIYCILMQQVNIPTK